VSFKRFRVRVGGIDHDVEVGPDTAGGREVIVDGRTHRVVAAPDRGWRVETLGHDVPHHCTVHLGPRAPERAASSGGITTTVSVQTAQQAAMEDALAVSRGGTDSGASIKSPMPGRIVRVLVEEGASVEADQSLVIVEAMKMENEVRAPAAGIVAKVAVQAGQTVEAGHLLLELAPHSEDPDAS
jgi:biotin carboxyl carrier protein